MANYNHTFMHNASILVKNDEFCANRRSVWHNFTEFEQYRLAIRA